MKTRERITEEALNLFSEYGYKGTSVKQIADAVGIKDASLYKHFKSKQEIFESIVELIKNQMSDLSKRLALPDVKDIKLESAILPQPDEELFIRISKEAFLFYLTDPYVSKFWRIAHMEQYASEEIYTMFRQLFMDDAITYLTQLFASIEKKGIIITDDPQATAIAYYAPIFLLLTRYENQPNRIEEALSILEKQVGLFFGIYKNKTHQEEMK